MHGKNLQVRCFKIGKLMDPAPEQGSLCS